MDPRDGGPDADPAAVTPGAVLPGSAGSGGGVDLRHHDDPDGAATSVIDRRPSAGGIGVDPDDDPDGGPTTLLAVPTHRRGRDWNWVEEARSDGDPPAWGPGIAVGIVVAAIVAVALMVLTSGLVDNPLLAVLINLVIGAGMAPALWLSRSLPVLRFLAGGAAAGLVIGWIWMLATYPGTS